MLTVSPFATVSYWIDQNTAIDKVEETVKEHQPNLLVSSHMYLQDDALFSLCEHFRLTCYQFCASMWTPEEAQQIQSTARSIVPDIKTHAIPQGLQVEKGPDAIVEYLREQIPKLLG